jgi:RsiW-degrading membrane proteinase PrsW (M82 family)
MVRAGERRQPTPTPLAGVLRRQGWLVVLVAGAALYLLVERTLVSTGNVHYVPSLLLLGAFVVPISFVTFVYGRSAPWTVGAPVIVVSAVFGGVIGTVVAGRLEYDTLIQLGFLPTSVIGLSEEAAKLIGPLVAYLWIPHRSAADGLILGVASGMGFAALETMGYGFVALLRTGGSLAAVDQLLFLRGVLAPASHAAWTGAAAAALYAALSSGRLRAWLGFVAVFVAVVVLHALWDSQTWFVSYVVLGVVSTALLWGAFLVVRRRSPVPDQVRPW